MREIVTSADLITYLQPKIEYNAADVDIAEGFMLHITAMLYQFRYSGRYYLPKDLTEVIWCGVDRAPAQFEEGVACDARLGILVPRRMSRMFADEYLPLLVEAVGHPGLTVSSAGSDYLISSSTEFEAEFGMRVNTLVRGADRLGRVPQPVVLVE